MTPFSQKALRLILEYEGLNQFAVWPGGASGITIGYGYDLGYVTREQFQTHWGAELRDSAARRLGEVVGLRGPQARDRAQSVSDIRIPRSMARKVFRLHSLPGAILQTARAFPGVDALPRDAQGALVSLVYNRGPAMSDQPGQDRRREMRAIRDAVSRGDLIEIAAQLRSMKRLWEGRGLDGLIRRREAEARLVESCIAPELRQMPQPPSVASSVTTGGGCIAAPKQPCV